ncbi:MAG TPA: hypothetical protein VKF32_05430 [Thermoanaerobaculia bacterium]|nr:hypothetical protein [Thermoanaerobaculia bacterium]
MARAYAQGGMLHAFPWARFSLLTEGFGDKELAFHLLLAPFVVLFKAKSSGAGSASFSRVLAVSTCTAGKRNGCYLVERRRETPAR